MGKYYVLYFTVCILAAFLASAFIQSTVLGMVYTLISSLLASSLIIPKVKHDND